MRTTAVSAAVLLLASPAALPFAHLWDIQEVYSNANGTVQFVEFFTTGFSELFLTGVQLQLKVSGTPVNSFTFPSDLPGTTTENRTFLAATANFVTLYGITPDYIIPPNFLSGGANNLLDYGGFDQVSLADLPANGVMSLNGLPDNDVPDQTSINAQATPRNFAGQQVTIPEPTTSIVLFVSLGAVAARRRRQLR